MGEMEENKRLRLYNEQNNDKIKTKRLDNKIAKIIQKSTEKEITQQNKGTIRGQREKKS